jgi:hypothetical protein
MSYSLHPFLFIFMKEDALQIYILEVQVDMQ